MPEDIIPSDEMGLYNDDDPPDHRPALPAAPSATSHAAPRIEPLDAWPGKLAPHEDILGDLIWERYVCGLRADESRARAAGIRARGMVTKRTCRPLAHWSAVDVFAFLCREGLPVHPVYAMTYAGSLDRRWMRVHPLCTVPRKRKVSSIHGRDTASWEDDYYGDVIAAAPRSRGAAL